LLSQSKQEDQGFFRCQVFSACDTIAARKTEEVDLGKANDKFFFSSLAIGFGNNLFKEVGSFFNIKGTLATISRGLTYKSFPVVFECDDSFKIETSCFSASIINCPKENILKTPPLNLQEGFDKTQNILSPKDGYLNLLIIPNLTKRQRIKFSNIILKGELEKFPPIFSLFKAKKIAINTRKPKPVFADGIKIGKTPLEVKIADEKLRVVVGKNRSF